MNDATTELAVDIYISLVCLDRVVPRYGALLTLVVEEDELAWNCCWGAIASSPASSDFSRDDFDILDSANLARNREPINPGILGNFPYSSIGMSLPRVMRRRIVELESAVGREEMESEPPEGGLLTEPESSPSNWRPRRRSLANLWGSTQSKDSTNHKRAPSGTDREPGERDVGTKGAPSSWEQGHLQVYLLVCRINPTCVQQVFKRGMK